MKLITGHVIFRHGDRTPITTYPTDPVKEKDWPNGYGQLTSAGIEQQYRLGQYLRTRYDSILSTTYSPREIVIRSTDYDRTLMSAQSNLAGLYPKIYTINNKMPIQPIPIHTVPNSEDYLLGQNECFLYAGIGKEVYQSEEFRRLNTHYDSFFQKLKIWTKFPEITLEDSRGIPDSIFIEHIYNKAPAWADENVRKILANISDHAFRFAFWNDRIKRLRGGPVIQDIWLNMNNTKHGYTAPKLKMYSAHDSTVSAALAFLRINYPHQPQYASALFVDLYKQNETYFVKVEYLNVTDSNKAYAYVLDGCPSVECPLDTFTSIYQPRFPDTAEVECASKNKPPAGNGNNKLMIIILSIVVVALTAIVIGLFIYLYRRNHESYRQFSSAETVEPTA